jgi:hypothetical protein
MSDITEPYYSSADIYALEMKVARRIYENGYLAHKMGLRLKDCPPFCHGKWYRWWRAGWRKHSEENRNRKCH